MGIATRAYRDSRATHVLVATCTCRRQMMRQAATQLLDPISIPIQVGIRRVGGSLAESAPLVALKYR